MINHFNAMNNFQKQLNDYRLTTAEILYHMPDHPSVLQSYIWQEFDLAPHFPILKKFLDFWSKEIDASLHSVEFTHEKLITPVRWSPRHAEYHLQ